MKIKGAVKTKQRTTIDEDTEIINKLKKLVLILEKEVEDKRRVKESNDSGQPKRVSEKKTRKSTRKEIEEGDVVKILSNHKNRRGVQAKVTKVNGNKPQIKVVDLQTGESFRVYKENVSKVDH